MRCHVPVSPQSSSLGDVDGGRKEEGRRWEATVSSRIALPPIPGGRMRAVTVAPGTAESVRLEEVPGPDVSMGSVVVEALAVGICGTDAEIASGSYGWAPPGRDRLVLGHESLGRVVDPGPSGFAAGEHVVGLVRQPDAPRCPNCAVGEWDMCSNGRYTERGIKQADGFMAEPWRI